MSLARRSFFEYRRFWFFGLLLLPVLMALTAWQAYHFAKEEAQARAQERLSLYASSFEGAIEKFDYLPWMLAKQPRVQNLLTDMENHEHIERIQDFLVNAREASGADTLYLLNTEGLTLASSNYLEEGSFVGNNYAYRPYYLDAVNYGRGEFFAIGTTTGLPGYFLSQRVVNAAGRLLGVAVVKVDLEPLQADWTLAAEHVLVIDANQVVVLSSNPGWKYRMLNELSEEQVLWIQQGRQFFDVELQPLGRELDSHYRVSVGDERDADYVMAEYPLTRLGWTIIYMIPVQSLYKVSALVTSLVLVLYVLILMGSLWLRERSRRTQAALVAEKALREANDTLEFQVQERTAELNARSLELQNAQRELVQAGKLAALGTLSAGVAHELNQPITAIRTYTATAKKLLDTGRYESVAPTLDKVFTLIGRMSQIIKQMKAFVRESPQQLQPVNWVDRLSFVLDMLSARIETQAIELVLALPNEAWIRADATRIEQILLNLLSNALDATATLNHAKIEIQLLRQEEHWVFTLSDNGEHFDETQIDRLFDPFYSTKAAGEGMGLGLFICYGLIQDLGGSIRVERAEIGGAAFEVKLPAIDILKCEKS
ncbi:sensor histidine kinase [Nitrincola tibetensis]|uniref:C4-dicarboxylate transport sensor protein DctB n=1 Tax=Nitrincola tibetensis TaxID=2219697 RepID=A0A364NRR3_9GAMM|nr:ATP-binding protein [Nitrincola tibetensis]RAU19783.1 sensor histidine kinase [Nitrincola tibetensis]